jgi:hypothetical protein
MPRREPDTAEDVRAREPSAVLRPPRPRRVPNNDARRLGATRRARPSASNCARARDGDGTGRGSEDAGGLGAFPLGPGWAPCGRSRMPRRRLRDTASARSRLMPPRRSGSWTLRDRDEHEASEPAREATEPKGVKKPRRPGRRARAVYVAGWPRAPGMPGRRLAGQRAGRPSTACEPRRAVPAASVGDWAAILLVLFSRGCARPCVLACRADGVRRGDTGVTARVSCVLRPMRGVSAGLGRQADRSCGPKPVASGAIRFVESCLEVRSRRTGLARDFTYVVYPAGVRLPPSLCPREIVPKLLDTPTYVRA